MSYRRVSVAAAIAAAVSAVSIPVCAVDNVWTGSVSNNWNDPGNWSLGRVPTKTNGQPAPDDFDDAIVNSAGAQAPLINADLAATPRDIIVGIGAGTVGQVNHVAGTAATGGGNWLYIGRNGGSGTYNLADPSTTGGTFTGMGLGSGSLNVSGRIYVAGATDAAATGVLNVNTSGTITTGNDLNIGAANGNGTVNLDHGTLNIGGWISVGRDENGNSGTGTWNQSGGDVTVAGNTVLGLPGTHGTLNFTGGTMNTTGEMWVGNDVGVGVPSVGQANVSGGTVTINNWLAVGRNGSQGTLNISGNGKVVKVGGGHITIGTGNGGNGTVNVSGNGVLSSNADLIVAENNPAAVAVVNQTAGSVLVGGNLDVQRNGTGTYNLSGGTLSVDGRTPDANTDQVTGIDARQGTFTFTGGRITRSNAGVIQYVGDLHVGNKSAGFTLNADKTFAVSGLLDVSQGVTLDVTGDALPGKTSSVQAGSFALGTDNSILGTFDPSTTTLVGLANTPGATFISETAGEGGLFDSSAQSVFWVQENGGQVSLQYSVAPTSAPEPASLALVGLSGIALIGRRRRR